MSIDVVDLRNFYGQRLGVVARRFIGRGIRKLWGDTAGQRVLGIGYATPYLGLFREEAERCLALMPAGQGVVKWPTARPALSALVDENELPLPDSAVDRVMLVHALEMTNDPGALLREVWRVLASGWLLLAVVPVEVAQQFAAKGMLRVLAIDFDCGLGNYGIATSEAQLLSPACSRFIDVLREEARRLSQAPSARRGIRRATRTRAANH